MYVNVGVRPVLGGGATFIGIPYCCATVPRSGCRFAFWLMLPNQVWLELFTGSAEMSVLKTLLNGNSVQVVPGNVR